MGLNIYTARENIDKERFIYENVEGETFVIVPNQYTLVAEGQAMHHMGTACLYDVEIISMNRLGSRILAERGLENIPVLDKYGRFMLLSRIIKDKRGDLEIFRKAAGKRGFAAMVNDFISDMKQQDIAIDEIDRMSDGAGELLRAKLEELGSIIREYEAEIDGKYTDSEDRIGLYIKGIADSSLVLEKSIWIYGYDSITPKFRDAVTELAKAARDVNFVVNESDFGLDRMLISSLMDAAREKGIEVNVGQIPAGYEAETSETVARIEHDLFCRDIRGASERNADFDAPDLMVTECANQYSEAESAAVYVQGLIRDEGYRMQDIVIVSNDEGGMQPKVRRMFDEYDIPLFVDTRSGIGDSRAAALTVSLLEFVIKGHRTNAMLTMLKSGLTGYDTADIEELENYVRDYNIRGTMWDRPFKYGAHDHDEEVFSAIEEIRADVMDRVSGLEKIIAESENVASFAKGFYHHLEDVWDFSGRLETIAKAEADSGRNVDAQRTKQGYDAMMHILDQIVEIRGEDALDAEEFLSLYEEGMADIEIGTIPPAIDALTIGTMIRTRPAPVRAVVILGANEGVLPLEPSPEGLFSVDEKAYFAERDLTLGTLDDIKMLEENVAMYRMMSKAREKVYVSYSLTDGNGDDMKPSSLIDTIRTAFKNVKIEKDVVSKGFGMDLVNSRRGTLRHLINHVRSDEIEGDGTLARAVMKWYDENSNEVLEPLISAGRNENEAAPLSREMARRLYTRDGNDYSFSASRLERYEHCPFRHFVVYGLRPVEERKYSGDARSIGDIYHECIMRVSRRITGTEDGAPIGDALANYSDDDIVRMVGEELYELSEEYEGGLFLSSEREKYRLARIAAVCEDAIKTLAEQMRSGKLSAAYFEESFGRGCRFDPMVYDIDGDRIYIEGKIDRIDVLAGGNVRVIDYKTGSDKLDLDQMRSGYKMQLMVYLESAVGGDTGDRDMAPAGMFYFNISDSELAANDITAEKLDEKIADHEAKRFKLRGAYVDDAGIMDEMPRDAIDRSSKSLTREEFEQLESDVRNTMERIAGGIVSGDISIEPTKERGDKSRECEYCDYRPICRFDLTYKGNKYKIV